MEFGFEPSATRFELSRCQLVMTVQVSTVQLRRVSLIREQQPPLFGPCLLSSNDWMDQDAIWYGLWRHVSAQTTLC